VRLGSTLLRTPGEHPPPNDLLRPAVRRRGRPRVEYVATIRTPEDAISLRRRGLPVYVLTSDWVSRHGYPVEFRPWLVVPERIANKVTSAFRILPVRDEDAVRDPGLEETVTFLLRFDPVAARLVAVRNRRNLDAHELYRRVRNEGVEAAATRVRLQEFSPAIPRVGSSISRSELAWLEKNNPPLGAMS
jgi:hypothetical protein